MIRSRMRRRNMEKRKSRKKNKIRNTWLAKSRTERGWRGIRR
jgi:hypothetical protein